MSYRIRRARPCDLVEVATIHQLAFPGFFMSLLGLRFLKLYYGAILEYPQGTLLVAEGDANAIIGFAAGFRDPSSFYGRIKDARYGLAIAAAPAIVRRPWLLRRLWNMRRQDPRLARNMGGEDVFEFSSIGVHPKYARQGLGTMLVRGIIREAHGMGASEIHLLTDAKDNDYVNQFYSRLGFTVKSRVTTTHDREMNHLVLLINGTGHEGVKCNSEP